MKQLENIKQYRNKHIKINLNCIIWNKSWSCFQMNLLDLKISSVLKLIFFVKVMFFLLFFFFVKKKSIFYCNTFICNAWFHILNISVGFCSSLKPDILIRASSVILCCTFSYLKFERNSTLFIKKPYFPFLFQTHTHTHTYICKYIWITY